MRKLTTLLVLGAAAVGLGAGEAEKPFYGRVSALFSQGDLRQFLGGQSLGYGFEAGYDWTKPEDLIGLSLYGGYVRWNGDYHTDLDVTQQMTAWKAGIDLRFNTPVKGLQPYAGLGLAFFNGTRVSDSSVLGDAGPYPDTNAKFGIRLGVEYKITPAWAVAVDYNAFEWRSDINNELGAAYQVPGYNPVNPSWLGVSVQYRFDF